MAQKERRSLSMSTQVNLAQRIGPLESLNSSQGKYNKLDEQESGISEKFIEIFRLSYE